MFRSHWKDHGRTRRGRAGAASSRTQRVAGRSFAAEGSWTGLVRDPDGRRDHGACRHVAAALLECLHGREMVLVLNSCEHLIDAVAAIIGRILVSAPGEGAPPTSREPMGLGRERLRRLPDAQDAAVLIARIGMTCPFPKPVVGRARDRLETFRLTDPFTRWLAELSMLQLHGFITGEASATKIRSAWPRTAACRAASPTAGGASRTSPAWA